MEAAIAGPIALNADDRLVATPLIAVLIMEGIEVNALPMDELMDVPMPERLGPMLDEMLLIAEDNDEPRLAAIPETVELIPLIELEI